MELFGKDSTYMMLRAHPVPMQLERGRAAAGTGFSQSAVTEGVWMGALTQQSRHHPQALKVLPAHSPGGTFGTAVITVSYSTGGTLERPGFPFWGARAPGAQLNIR
jgi:hypothetical protein